LLRLLRSVLPDADLVTAWALCPGPAPHHPPRTIRDDISANLDAVEKLEADHPGLELILATLAQGREGGAAALSIRADLAEQADLIADPGALIVCQGSRVDVRLELALGAGAAVDWRELIVLGRTGEPAGHATLRWDVTGSAVRCCASWSTWNRARP
jgi:hypothetical protein